MATVTIADLSEQLDKISRQIDELREQRDAAMQIVNRLVDYWDETAGNHGPHTGSAFGDGRTWNDAVLDLLGKVSA